jgi:hypothetical protein
MEYELYAAAGVPSGPSPVNDADAWVRCGARRSGSASLVSAWGCAMAKPLHRYDQANVLARLATVVRQASAKASIAAIDPTNKIMD